LNFTLESLAKACPLSALALNRFCSAAFAFACSSFALASAKRACSAAALALSGASASHFALALKPEKKLGLLAV
jgi:hypothetical protein